MARRAAAPPLPDWNLVVTTRPRRFAEACEVIGAFGPLRRTTFFNVLVGRIGETEPFLETMRARFAQEPELASIFGRIVPAARCFDFASPEEFTTRAEAIALGWLDRLAGSSFHIRLHRRGGKQLLAGHPVEKLLDDALIDALRERGATATVSFDDPEHILIIETVGTRAGLSLWSREERARYPFLNLD